MTHAGVVVALLAAIAAAFVVFGAGLLPPVAASRRHVGNALADSLSPIVTLAASTTAAQSDAGALQRLLGNEGPPQVHIKLLVVNDGARTARLGPDNVGRDAEMVVEEAQRLLHVLSAGAGVHVNLHLTRVVSIRQQLWWERAHELSHELILQAFGEWLRRAYEDGLPEKDVVPCLLAGASGVSSHGGAAVQGALLQDVGTARLVVDATAKSVPATARQLARQLARLIGVPYDGELGAEACRAQWQMMEPTAAGNTSWSECSVAALERFPLQREEALKRHRCGTARCEMLTGITFPGGPGSASLPKCGNGVVDAGEDCDCVGPQCDTCCDMRSCSFAPGAQCTSDDGCCTSSCRIRPRGFECRASRDNSCDTREICDGVSAACPADHFRSTGAMCGPSGTRSCFAGACIPDAAELCFVRGYMGLCEESNGCGTLACRSRHQDLRSKRFKEDCVAVFSGSAALPFVIPDGTSCTRADGEDGVCKGPQCVAPWLLKEPLPATCANGIKDERETDVDCGGPHCVVCALNQTCTRDSDCLGGDGSEGDGTALGPPRAACLANPTASGFSCQLHPDPDDERLAARLGDFFATNGLVAFALIVIPLLVLVCGTIAVVYVYRMAFVGQARAIERRQLASAGGTSARSARTAVVPDARSVRMQSTARAFERLHKMRAAAAASAKEVRVRTVLPNSQPDVLNKWACVVCSTTNNGFLTACASCGAVNPADEEKDEIAQLYDIDFVPAEEEQQRQQQRQQQQHELDLAQACATWPAVAADDSPLFGERTREARSRSMSTLAEDLYDAAENEPPTPPQSRTQSLTRLRAVKRNNK